MMVAQILLYEREWGGVGADVMVGSKPVGHAYSSNSRIEISLKYIGEKAAYHINYNGVTFGEYEIVNGRTCLLPEGIGKIKDPRVYSTINFAILNEMMRLTKPNSLEVKAA